VARLLQGSEGLLAALTSPDCNAASRLPSVLPAALLVEVAEPAC